MAQYEKVAEYACDLSIRTAEMALGQLGLARPVLRVHKEEIPFAIRLNREGFGGFFNIEADDEITDYDEWYVEYNGRRVGSEGD